MEVRSATCEEDGMKRRTGTVGEIDTLAARGEFRTWAGAAVSRACTEDQPPLSVSAGQVLVGGGESGG